MTELAFDRADQIRHAYIISSSDPDTALRAAKRIAMAAVCRARGKLPCGVCEQCEKVAGGHHPDVRMIGRLTDEKGKAKRELTVDQIRGVSADAAVLPNESEHKVYIFPEAGKMNLQAQNAALKLLEEPPVGVILLLCVSSPDELLTTVRSRCAEITLFGETEQSGQRELASEYLALCAEADLFRLWKWCENNNDLSVSEMAELLRSISGELTEMLCGRKDSMGMDTEQLFRLERLAETCSEYLEVNTSVKHLFGLIGVESIRETAAGKEKRGNRN